jgi:hypothetical protein
LLPHDLIVLKFGDLPQPVAAVAHREHGDEVELSGVLGTTQRDDFGFSPPSVPQRTVTMCCERGAAFLSDLRAEP